MASVAAYCWTMLQAAFQGEQRGVMSDYDFFQRPILNSPYEEPQWHHVLDDTGQPTNAAPKRERRKSDLYTPVPKAKRARKTDAQPDLLEDEQWRYNPTPIINEIRQHVRSWRDIPNPKDWGVTPATQRL